MLDTLSGVHRSALTRIVIADSTERIQGEAIMFASTDDYPHFISKEQKDNYDKSGRKGLGRNYDEMLFEYCG